jgi:hypothetical protein
MKQSAGTGVATMTDIRTQMLEVFKELSDRFPEFRFGQMIVGLAWSARDFTNSAVFDVKDD